MSCTKGSYYCAILL